MVDEQAIKEALQTKAREHHVAAEALLQRIQLSVPATAHSVTPERPRRPWQRLQLGRKLEVLAACVLLAGLLTVVAVKQHGIAPAGGDKNPPVESGAIADEPGGRRSKPESMTNIRITEQGMELGPEISTPTMWAQGFHRVGMSLAEPIDLEQITTQVQVKFVATQPVGTLFQLQVRGSQDQQNWSEWSEVQASGAVVGLKAKSRYVQYWIHLAANESTPIVKDVVLIPIPSGGPGKTPPFHTGLQFRQDSHGQPVADDVMRAYIPGGPKMPNFQLTDDALQKVLGMLRTAQFIALDEVPPPPTGAIGEASQLVLELGQGDTLTVYWGSKCNPGTTPDGRQTIVCQQAGDVLITRQGKTGRFSAPDLANWLTGDWTKDVTGLH